MRIITGSAKGCNLKAPKGLTTRPTSDRIKGSVFNMLGQDVLGAQVLDLFAGTGALGLEALSRGAEHCTFIDKGTGDILEYNARHTKLLDRCRILSGDVFTQLSRLKSQGRQFDLIFCDPPYEQGFSQRVLLWLEENDILAENGLLIIEHGGKEELPPTGKLRLIRNKKYGHTTQMSFYHFPLRDEAGGEVL